MTVVAAGPELRPCGFAVFAPIRCAGSAAAARPKVRAAAIALAALTRSSRSSFAKLLGLGWIDFGDKIGRSDAKRRGQMKQGDDRWITPATLQIADILLGKA